MIDLTHDSVNQEFKPFLSSGIELKILHIIASVDPKGGGPIEGVVQQSICRMQNQDLVHILSLDDPNQNIVSQCLVKTFACGKLRPRDWRRFLPWVHYGWSYKAVNWLKANHDNYDIVVVNGLWNFATMTAKLGLVDSRTPYVVFTHGMLDPWFKKAYPLKAMAKQISWWLCEGPLLKHAKYVLFTAEEEQRLAHDAFWPYKVNGRVVGYGTADIPKHDPAQDIAFREKVPNLGTRPYLLYLSRIHPKKGCDLLIEAFARIASEYPELDLVIAGPDQTGWQPKLQAIATKLGIGDRIHWPGMVQDAAKWGAFYGCEAFILPSHQENFGIVVAEAMAAAKPVLISNKINIWREIEVEKCGLVETDTLDGTIALLRNFLRLTAQEKTAMGEAGRTTFMERYEIIIATQNINLALEEACRVEPT